MVSLVGDIVSVRSTFEQEKQKLKRERRPYDPKVRLGSMIETPAAVLEIDEILKKSDFLSIGTNDLIQYTMAADRENAAVAGYYRVGALLILKWIQTIVRKSDAAGAECELCGELAGSLDFTDELLKRGLRQIKKRRAFLL